MKITPLPSVEKEVEKTMQKLGGIDRVDDPQMFNDFFDLLTQDRNQAYTSLVAGIKAQVKDINGESSVFDDFATDIIENVVKPLYGKE